MRALLQAPYNGPFKVVHRTDKYFTLDINGRQDSVSINMLKPSYTDGILPSTDFIRTMEQDHVSPTLDVRCIHLIDSRVPIIQSHLHWGGGAICSRALIRTLFIRTIFAWFVYWYMAK